MNSAQKQGLVFGFIILFGWNFVSTISQWTFFSAFNFFMCIAWMYLVYKINFENKEIFLRFSSYWIGLNWGLIFISIIILVFHSDYLYLFPIAFPMFATATNLIVFFCSDMINKSFVEYDHQQPMPQGGNLYESKMCTNKSNRNSTYREFFGDDMVDNTSNPRGNTFVAVSMPYDSEPPSYSYDHHITSDDCQSHLTSSHDTQTSSHDTQDYGVCDSGGGETGGCDSGGGADTVGDCGGGADTAGDCGGGDY